MEYTSQIFQNIDNGLTSGIISFNEDNSRITYHCIRDYQTSFKNPEEKIRASFFVELVQTYQYPINCIDLEVTVPNRTHGDYVDIIVYTDNDNKETYLVVECKKEGITDAEFKQAIEQVFVNANSLHSQYASVVAGNTKTAFNVSGFKHNERERNVIADIPLKYGLAPKYKYIKGDKNKDLKVVTREDLISALEKCHDTVWQGGKFAPTTAFDEVSKLLFCKMKDEKDGTKKNEPYSFQIGTQETAEEVAERIDKIYQVAKNQDSEVFKENIKLEPKVIYSVVEHLQSLSLNKTDLDTKGVAFEKFMIDYFKGKMGQFFTPRPIIEFAVKLLEPKHTDIVIDPSCGSGGFLLSVLDTIRKEAEGDYDEKDSWEIWHNFAKKNLFGIEINDQIARICKMNMIIHDDGHTNIISTDSLRFLKEIKEDHKGFKENHFSLLLANPPFGAVVKSAEKEKKYLDQYKLGEGRQNQKTEILFIERSIEFLKEGTGRMGIILPDGILTNSSLSYVRDFLISKCQILAVISLPSFTFSHFGASVKSSIVFARRKDESEVDKDYKIFMAVTEAIGYDAGGKETNSELPYLLSLYKEFQNSQGNFVVPKTYTDKIIIVNKSDLKNRLDVTAYKSSFKYKSKSFPLVSLSEIAYVNPITNFEGLSDDTEITFIPMDAIDEKIGEIYYSETKRVSETKGYTRFKEMDLIWAKITPCMQNGKSAIVLNTINGYACGSTEFYVIRPKKGNVLVEYLHYILRDERILETATNYFGGSAGQQRVPSNFLLNLDVPLLPIKIQQEIVRKWKEGIERKKKLEKQAKKLLLEVKNQIDLIIEG